MLKKSSTLFRKNVPPSDNSFTSIFKSFQAFFDIFFCQEKWLGAKIVEHFSSKMLSRARSLSLNTAVEWSNICRRKIPTICVGRISDTVTILFLSNWSKTVISLVVITFTGHLFATGTGLKLLHLFVAYFRIAITAGIYRKFRLIHLY